MKVLYSIVLAVAVAAVAWAAPGDGSGTDQRVLKPVAASAEAVQPVLTGTTAPPVTLKTVDGEEFNLRAEAKRGPLALVFYRGGWCPYCTKHLQALKDALPKMKDLGYRLAAISPDKPEKLAESVKEYDLDYILLSDSAMEAARAFGIAFQVDAETVTKYKGYGIDLEEYAGEAHAQLPVPAVFLLDTGSVIQFSYVNPDYSVRLDGEVLLAAAKAAVK